MPQRVRALRVGMRGFLNSLLADHLCPTRENCRRGIAQHWQALVPLTVYQIRIDPRFNEQPIGSRHGLVQKFRGHLEVKLEPI